MALRHQRKRELSLAAVAHEVKGWCPGALRPMQSGDGLIVRIRPRTASFGPDQLTVLADAARRFGNGHIDLTRRANLQIRGVSEASLPLLHDVIARLGLLDEDPDGEAVRNVMINPLAGMDPAEVLDVRNIGRELARLLASQKAIWALPGKFGFVVDGGGILTLAGQHADVRLTAVGSGPDVAVAIGLETGAGVDWLGSVSPDMAAATAIDIGLVFIGVASRERRQRMRDLSSEGLASIRSAMTPRLNVLCENPSNADASSVQRIGLVRLSDDQFAVGIAAPFGRIEADQLQNLSEAMAAGGASEIRLSPWRTLYAVVPDQQAAQTIFEVAANDGLIVDPGDPLLQIEACPGSAGCRSTSLDTRRDGRTLARLLPRFGFTGTIHVSGCVKGCAKSGRTDLVLVGADDAYGVVRNGTVGDRCERSLSVSNLADDMGKIFETNRGAAHD
jgi:precorrin-3B synthase